jgi:hypothetical protein
MDITVEQRMTDSKKLIDSVRILSNDFVGEDMPVAIHWLKVNDLAEQMLKSAVIKFEKQYDLGAAQTILMELYAGSINYCFWYGKYDFRPMDSDSQSMYDIIQDTIMNHFEGVVGPEFVNKIIDRLIFDRYPLVEERVRHIMEVSISTQEFIMFVIMNKNNNARIVLHELVRRFPGYASDMFLKRAFLFCYQLNRKLGWFEDTIDELPVPADYQVPKMLEYFNCITYKQKLMDKIENSTMIPKWSMEEISIRGATILVCDRLAELTKWTKSDIDAWLWLRRKECKTPFHLTITTDY